MGTATAATDNDDFDGGDIIVEFHQSEDEKTVEIPIIDDETEEYGIESFVVRIRDVRQSPTGAVSPTDGIVDNDNRETVVYISDDDGERSPTPPPPTSISKFGERVKGVRSDCFRFFFNFL